MPWNSQLSLETSLRPAPSREHYDLHLAALEWSLAEAIVIQSAEDIRSRVKWQGNFKPFEHQVKNLFTFCRRSPVTLLTDDVGLGKTISAGLILCELMVRRRVRRALVLCPTILCPQWVEELKSKFGIAAVAATGQQLVQELREQVPVVVSTYETASKYLTKDVSDAFEMLILDEAHKLRNLHGGSKPPALAVNMRSALEQRMFKFVVMLTATPIHNRLWDLYSLIDCLTRAKGHRNPFGAPEQFKQKYLLPSSDGRRLRENAEIRRTFHEVVREYLVRTRRGDARLKFPNRTVETCEVQLSEPEAYLVKLVRRNIENLNVLQQTSLAQALMSSPHALAAQLDGMAESGSFPRAIAIEAQGVVGRISEPAKLKKLLTLVEELKSQNPVEWRVVVFTLRKETQQLIGRELQRRGIEVGFIVGGASGRNKAAIDRFVSKPPGIHVLVSTDAGAEGVNLQAANFLVNYDLPWNPTTVEQRIGRIQRLGSEHEHVIVCNLVAADSVEANVVCRLMEKLQGIAEAIGDIESILEATEGDEKERAGERFASQVRRLVVQSLIGKDVAETTQLMEESVERARRLIEKQRHELDIAFGRADDVGFIETRMPCLKRIAPSIAVEKFVLRAKQADGNHVEERGDGTYTVSRSGQIKEVIEFQENSSQQVFMGITRLYEPGRPAFERLVQHWVDHYGHLVRDLRSKTAAQVDALARKWCQTILESEFQACEIQDRRSAFQGRVRLRVKASNGVDSYEKLLWRSIHPYGHSPIPVDNGAGNLMVEEVRPQKIIPNLSDSVARTVEADEDVRAFCDFYEERCQEEMARAEGDPRREYKVRSDFTPSVAADIVGLDGVRYEEVTIRVRFTIGGKGSYEAKLSTIPASGQILQEPLRAKCMLTDLSVPKDCLAVCAITHRRILRHRLVKSEESGRLGFSRYSVRCAVTDKLVFTDEVETSDLSGRQAIRALCGRSQTSDRCGLPDELERCEITGKMLLRDELIISDVSSKRFNKYEEARSDVSGKRGHHSEFIRCAKTGESITPEESATSAYSDKIVRKDLLGASENPPHRLGLEEEFGFCEQSGKRLLRDELDHSTVSGKLVDRNLLRPSTRSGQLALECELIQCAESKDLLLPEETDYCSVTGDRVDLRLLSKSEVSSKRGLTRLMKCCAASRKFALPSELEQCALTEDWVIPSELEICAVTKRRVRRSELITCQKTGDRILPSESGKSDYSWKIVRADLLKQSENPPHRLGLDEEFGLCGRSHKRLLLDELGQSDVSGKIVDRRLLQESNHSGKLALPEEMIACAESGVALLPCETDVCTISRKRVDTRLLSKSEVSDDLGLTRLMKRCEETGLLALPSELEQCESSEAWVLPSLLETCAVTGKRVLRCKLVRCQKTGNGILPSASGASDYSGKIVRADLLRSSENPPYRLGLEEEFGFCEQSGKRLLRDELDYSAVSGKLVDQNLLRPSARSGKRGLEGELIECAESKAFLLPEETDFCSETGTRVDKRLLSKSEVSGKRGLSRLMKRCAVTGTLTLPSELEPCGWTGDWTLPIELDHCAIIKRRVRISELETCAVTGRKGVRERVLRSAVSSKYVTPSHAIHSAVSGAVCLPEEGMRCAWLQKPILKREAGNCKLTRMKVAACHLNKTGEFSILRELLDGRLEKATAADDLLPFLRSLNDTFRHLRNVRVIASPEGKSLAVCGELRGLLGFRVRYVGFLLRNKGERQIIGRYSIGSRTRDGWLLEEQH